MEPKSGMEDNLAKFTDGSRRAFVIRQSMPYNRKYLILPLRSGILSHLLMEIRLAFRERCQ
jgi:hypothetical protein